jgi:hypothetical protein
VLQDCLICLAYILIRNASFCNTTDYLQNNEDNLDRIGHKTSCCLETRDWKGLNLPVDPSFVYIATTQFDAKKNLVRAKEDVENVLINYIHRGEQ